MTRKKNKTYRVIKTKKKEGKGQFKTRKICLLARIIAPNVGPMGLLILFITAHKVHLRPTIKSRYSEATPSPLF
jgi:hypothetical protein